MTFDHNSALCLVNWDTSASIVDDGSYVNWLEGTRILEAAIDVLPMGVSHVATECADAISDDTTRLKPQEAIEALRDAAVTRVFVAGNFIERDVVPFTLTLVQAGLEPILLFDVCGTLDPMAKWQSLAGAVDDGVKVSTVQQTLGMLTGETSDPGLKTRITEILNAPFGELAVELSAA
jgi:hypothetical protein